MTAAWKRIRPGVYEGADVRAEKGLDGRWAFELRCIPLDHRRPQQLEYSPGGLFRPIGRCKSLTDGLVLAERLRRRTHFYDADAGLLWPFTPAIHEALRTPDITDGRFDRWRP